MVTRYNRIFKKDDCHFVVFIKMNKLILMKNVPLKITLKNIYEFMP